MQKEQKQNLPLLHLSGLEHSRSIIRATPPNTKNQTQLSTCKKQNHHLHLGSHRRFITEVYYLINQGQNHNLKVSSKKKEKSTKKNVLLHFIYFYTKMLLMSRSETQPLPGVHPSIQKDAQGSSLTERSQIHGVLALLSSSRL